MAGGMKADDLLFADHQYLLRRIEFHIHGVGGKVV